MFNKTEQVKANEETIDLTPRTSSEQSKLITVQNSLQGECENLRKKIHSYFAEINYQRLNSHERSLRGALKTVNEMNLRFKEPPLLAASSLLEEEKYLSCLLAISNKSPAHADICDTLSSLTIFKETPIQQKIDILLSQYKTKKKTSLVKEFNLNVIETVLIPEVKPADSGSGQMNALTSNQIAFSPLHNELSVTVDSNTSLIKESDQPEIIIAKESAIQHELPGVEAGNPDSTNAEALLLRNKINAYLMLFDYQQIFMYQTELTQWLAQLEKLNKEAQPLLAKEQIHLRCLLALSKGKGGNDPNIVNFRKEISRRHANEISLNENRLLQATLRHIAMSSAEVKVQYEGKARVVPMDNKIDRLLAAFKEKIDNEDSNHHPKAKCAALGLYEKLVTLRHHLITPNVTDKAKEAFLEEANKAFEKAKPNLQHGLSMWEYIENMFAHIRSFFANPKQYCLFQQSIFKMHTTPLRQSADQLNEALNIQLKSAMCF